MTTNFTVMGGRENKVKWDDIIDGKRDTHRRAVFQFENNKTLKINMQWIQQSPYIVIVLVRSSAGWLSNRFDNKWQWFGNSLHWHNIGGRVILDGHAGHACHGIAAISVSTQYPKSCLWFDQVILSGPLKVEIFRTSFLNVKSSNVLENE